MYYQSPRNPNLIAIVPVDEPSPLQQLTCPVEKTEPYVESCPQGKLIIFIQNKNILNNNVDKCAFFVKDKIIIVIMYNFRGIKIPSF